MYAVVAAAAIIENLVPPAPADVVITLAAFLSHRGTTSAGTVFTVTWLANVAGALLVYVLARRLGQGFTASGLGRRLITPDAVVAVERRYLRFGLVGLFVARLLPGFRSFTAPFAGLIQLSLPRTLLPIALASGLWYGGLVFLGSRLAANWETVREVLRGLNTTLGLIAVATAVAAGVWFAAELGRRRAARRAELATALTPSPLLERQVTTDPAVAAVAALAVEMTVSEGGALSADELEALERHLRASWHLDRDLAGEGTQPVAPADAARARELVTRLAPAERVGLANRLVAAAFPEGVEARSKAHVMERVAQVLGVSSDALDRTPPPQAP